MSIMTCSDCCAYIDTDFDVEGAWDDRPGKTGFWCQSCVESGTSQPMLEALAFSNPKQFLRCLDCKLIVDNELDPDCECTDEHKYGDTDMILCESCREKRFDAEEAVHLASYQAEKAAEQNDQDLIDAGRGHQTATFRDNMLDAADLARKASRGG